MNHTRFPKEDHLPDCASWDNQVKKGARVDYVLARNKRGFLVKRLEVFIDVYVVQENIRCLSREKLAISIPRTQTSLLHKFLSVTCNKSISEFIDTCK